MGTLLERHGIEILRPYHVSWEGGASRRREVSAEGEDESFPARFRGDDSDVGQLVFALKYDGVDLLALRKILEKVDPGELVAAIEAKRTSAYLRRLWYFWEFFRAGERLPVEDCPTCPTVELIDSKGYYTREGSYQPRQRIRDNLLGNNLWCPMVRRSEILHAFEQKDLRKLAQEAAQAIPQAVLQRAIRYLHTKETRSSYEIERTKPDSFMERFVEMLLSSSNGLGWGTWWSREQFIEVQKRLLDERYASDDFRDSDNRVSSQSNLSGAREEVHWVGAPHQAVEELMRGLISAWQAHHLHELTAPKPGALDMDGRPYESRKSCGDPFVDFVVAVCLSFGFVYIHPFDDGNGRMHRLLLHHVLNRTGFTPPGIVVPISATILSEHWNYDRVLESYSRKALPFIGYTIDEHSGEIVTRLDSVDFYRYIDYTPHVEQLCQWFEQSVQKDLIEEVDVLQRMDEARNAMRMVVDLPDRKMQLFLAICVENGRKKNPDGFKIGKKKREIHLQELTDEEVEGLEDAIAQAFAEG